MLNDVILQGTKAETLSQLFSLGYNVPRVYYFSVKEWNEDKTRIVKHILKLFDKKLLAIRSSTNAEDTDDSSMAGAFESLLNVKPNQTEIVDAVTNVIESYDDDKENHILVQPMVKNVKMSGVIMTKVLDDGSPYHVINYDDSTGLTDTVTSGTTINKTVYIYNGVNKKDFDSPYLLKALGLIEQLETTFPNIPLDIEFAIDKEMLIHLLQVRKITTIKKWKSSINEQVSSRMDFLKEYVGNIMMPRPQLFGEKTLLGFMPDWNPAEMIGVVPRPLSMSLYRELITKKTWRIAREKMGYRKMPNTELMISLFGRPYIDVRNSANSFLPEGLSSEISEKLINVYISRLNENPYFHDKIEFEVILTSYDFDFDTQFQKRYPNLLSDSEFETFKSLLKNLTISALKENSTLQKAYDDIEKLTQLQLKSVEPKANSFSIADKITTLISECIEFGTIPFSILARHGFIAEGFLRSAISNKALSEERIKEFRRSIVTVAGDMSDDFSKVVNGNLLKSEYIKIYGHLRPSSYDILSPNYSNRADLFDGASSESNHNFTSFKLTDDEATSLNKLLNDHLIDGITAENLMSYAEKAIKGREYAKFIFTKHLSQILEYTAQWGELKGLSREDLSFLSINDIVNFLYMPLTNDAKNFYTERVNKGKNNFEVAASFKLSYLIRSVRDVHIVPMQRSVPNFIGNQRIEGEVVELTPYSKNILNLENKIICIEGADPGYDWIFTRNIAGLITKYGGANSHMAIRSAEYNIPAAIGCGEQPYERILKHLTCLLDCQGKRLEPIILN